MVYTLLSLLVTLLVILFMLYCIVFGVLYLIYKFILKTSIKYNLKPAKNIKTNYSLPELTDIGFKKNGFWELKNDNLNFTIFSDISGSSLYSFVINKDVKYIGVTKGLLSRRMYGYKKPGHSQLTNVRINKLLKEALKSTQKIEIYSLGDNDETLNKFNINLPAALEDDLIYKISPDWNIQSRQKSSLISEKKKLPKIKQITQEDYNGKYKLLYDYLKNNTKSPVTLYFEEIENIIKTKLPNSAYRHQEWWANGGHKHSEAWLKASWKVLEVSLGDYVIFENKL